MTKQRICFARSISALARPCALNELKKVMQSPQVKTICNEIARLSNESADNHEAISKLKKQLPAITPHAMAFVENKRKNEGATPSGLVMLDVDHVQKPEDFLRNAIQDGMRNQDEMTQEEWLKAQGIIFIAKTPSSKGLRVIGERKIGETLPEGARRLAETLHITEYDAVTKDLARLSFVMPWDYVYYINETAFEVPDDYVYEDTEHRTQNTEH